MFSEEKLVEFLGEALSHGGDWADIFIEETVKNKAELSDKKIKNVSYNQVSGAGIRVVKDCKEYYAYTNDLTSRGLVKLAKEVSQTVSNLSTTQKVALEDPHEKSKSLSKKSNHLVSWKDKINILKKADKLCRGVSSLITQVNAQYYDETQHVVIANSEGLYKQDKRTRGRFAVTSVASNGHERQMGYEAPGALRGFDFFESLNLPELCRGASERAITMLKAKYAPKGMMTVIIDSGFGGVIFHEACGHSLEATAVAKKSTVFEKSLGKMIASECVSAVDDGTMANEWGSETIDDEGETTQRNILIQNGRLVSFLVDRLNGDRINQKPNGSSRRESYRFSPTSRMHNTFILPGKDKLSKMISETDYGLYAKKLGGGSVNPATGEFNFAVTEGYLIKNGKIVEPVRGAVLIGLGSEILKKIDRVGDTLELAQGICGATSGWVPVNVGQPALRVQDLLVGGR